LSLIGQAGFSGGSFINPSLPKPSESVTGNSRVEKAVVDYPTRFWYLNAMAAEKLPYIGVCLIAEYNIL
jgi:hypothetical protein